MEKETIKFTVRDDLFQQFVKYEREHACIYIKPTFTKPDTGRLFVMNNIDLNTTLVQKMRNKVSTILNLGSTPFHLIYAGRFLNDNQSLTEAGVHPLSTILAIQKNLRGD